MNSITVLRTQSLAYTLSHQKQCIHPNDINLCSGEITMLTGPSGSGKTCFIDAIQGLVPLDHGKVHATVEMVRIYQDLRLVREHSALRNVLDGLVGQRKLLSTLVPSRKDREQGLYWLEQLGLRHKAMQPVFSLSAGEAQRVAIARAMISKPALLVADEPFSALDDANTDIIMALIERECKERGMAALIITHKVPYSKGIVPLHIIPFAPQVDASVQNITVKEAIIERRPLPLLSRQSSALALILLATLAALWLLPDVNNGNFSWELVGNFFIQWVPTTSELKAIAWLAIFTGLVDTLAMAILATLLAVCFSFPLAIVATREFMPDLIALPVRYALNWWRAIPSIIWALVCVAAVGLGTLSGLIALILYSMGYLTKFFYESFEQVDRKPADSLGQLGAGRRQIVALALWPMTLRPILSASLFMFEYNVRAATILGIVGAGGIGILLKESVEWSNWHVVGVIIFLMGFMVIMIDSFSSWLRRSLVPERKQMDSYQNRRPTK
jgi:phosphonate transport system permease protein